MSIMSEAFPLTYRKLAARMYVVRNDGFCYGRMAVTQPDGTIVEYDVPTKRDWYNHADDRAAEAFINAARKGLAEEPAASWRIEADE